ncbi:MAG: SUF system NifU family Fe-S cluster assembly protein [Bifidobacteriaceae bacterium]|nr:SUF system NifU family Fe-S cluster assembly protein [Bifidobacteriaceae bacterium]
MEDISELYKETILEASRNPHGRKDSFSEEGADGNRQFIHAAGFNSSCGDEVEMEVEMEDGVVKGLSWRGDGCAICTSSLSMLTDLVTGKSKEEAISLFYDFLKLMNSKGEGEAPESLGEAAALQGVSKFPMRIKCALLGWTTLKEALEKGGWEQFSGTCPIDAFRGHKEK